MTLHITSERQSIIVRSYCIYSSVEYSLQTPVTTQENYFIHQGATYNLDKAIQVGPLPVLAASMTIWGHLTQAQVWKGPRCVTFGFSLRPSQCPTSHRVSHCPHGQETNAATNGTNWHLCRQWLGEAKDQVASGHGLAWAPLRPPGRTERGRGKGQMCQAVTSMR